MKISRTILCFFIFFWLVFFSITSFANVDIEEAMNAYKAQKYDHAVKIILKQQYELEKSDPVIKLKVALIFLKNLKLYQDIYIKSKINQEVYLQTLVNEDVKQPSVYAKLYLAEVYILNNKLSKAKILLDDFRQSISKKSTEYQISKLFQAWIFWLERDKTAYEIAIKTIDQSNPILIMAVHYLEVLLTGKTTNISDQINAVKNANNGSISTRFANYAIRHFVNQQNIMAAGNILNQLDQRQASFIEKISKTKHIRFYDVTLIDTIAEFYYEISKWLLNDVSQDTKYHDMAIFYLSELDLIRLNKSSAKKYHKAVEKLRRLPKNIIALREIRSTTHGHLLGQTSRAVQAWQDAVNNFKNDPNQSADAVLMCLYLGVNCPKIVQTAQLSAENGRSKRFEKLSTNVGRYFLAKQHNAKALRLLESAMDRSNTNSLLANEAILLLNYAEALRINKNFSVSLQIYFSLGENFPIIRQLQDSVQNEYLFRQRSNGKTNVF